MTNERASDGIYLAYFPFGALSLVSQIAAYHKNFHPIEIVLSYSSKNKEKPACKKKSFIIFVTIK